MCRQEVKSRCSNYNDYLALLEMKVDIHSALPTEYRRIAELTQRANKCTNGKRCTVEEIKELTACKEIHVYAVMLADKFADMGLVGVVGVNMNCFCLPFHAVH